MSISGDVTVCATRGGIFPVMPVKLRFPASAYFVVVYKRIPDDILFSTIGTHAVWVVC